MTDSPSSARANVVIPVKGIGSGKSRLSDVLTDVEREALVERLAVRTLDIANRMRHISVTVVTLDPVVVGLAQRHGSHAILQSRDGLNAGLTEATVKQSDIRTVVVPADLPTLTSADIEAHVSSTGIGLSPDDHGVGTNMLSLPRPGTIPFRFGADSFSAHHAEAFRAGIEVTEIIRPGISFDIDTIDDLIRLKGWP